MSKLKISKKFKTCMNLVSCFVLILGCSTEDISVDKKATDYSQTSHWLSIPVTSKTVDVFYLYPTCWNKVDSTKPNICTIDDASMLKGSAAVYMRQATAFETVGNVFAPYYRQADAAYTLSLPEKERDEVIGGIPTTDAIAAFDYYIKHFNNGRPFILAGHSQGSNVMLFLLSRYMKENPDVYKRMIAAYVIGYPVTASYLSKNPHLKFATGPDDTGVIISYNTQSDVVQAGGNKVVGNNIGLVINPISWTRTETLATTEQGLGSYMLNPTIHLFSQVAQYADAKVNLAKGVLICSTAIEKELTLGFGPGVYHSYDYPFYYYNIRANAQNRVNLFLKK